MEHAKYYDNLTFFINLFSKTKSLGMCPIFLEKQYFKDLQRKCLLKVSHLTNKDYEVSASFLLVFKETQSI